jgi:ubiquinone/menaquinone biosynthesis C-methylase UbiE
MKELLDSYRMENGLYIGKSSQNKQWIGSIIAPWYDRIMENNVLPKKFDASYKEHVNYLKRTLGNINNKQILELSTGSGNMAEILLPDNIYYGVDISKSLLKIARRKFEKAGIKNHYLVVDTVENLPFEDSTFDIGICNLALNFYEKQIETIKEIYRVMKPNTSFYITVPVEDRNKKHSVIQGTIYSEDKIREVFEENGFEFLINEMYNGAILYCSATKN